MNKILGKKLKFNVNRYTIMFILLNLLLMIGVNSFFYILSNYVNINILKTVVGVFSAYCLILVLFFIITVNSDTFKKLDLSKEKIKSLKAHLKYNDKLSAFISKKTLFYKSEISTKIDDICYNNYYYETLITVPNYTYISDYYVYREDLKSGNEFWLTLADILTNRKKDNCDSHKIELFINIDNNLYKYKDKVLNDLQKLCTLNEKYLIRNRYSPNYNEEVNKKELIKVAENIDILEKAININNKLYEMDKYIPHKKMLNTLFDNWMVLMANYIVDTEKLLNDELIKSFNEIYTMVNKVVSEYEYNLQKIKEQETNEIRNVWNEQSKDYFNLIENIAKDFK